MPRGEDGQYELILETRQVLVIFLFAVVLGGVFFGLGFVVGRHSTGPTGTQVAAIPGTSIAVDKKSALSPAEARPASGDETPAADTPALVETPAPQPEKAPEKTPETKLPEKPVEKPAVEKPRAEPEKPPEKPKPAPPMDVAPKRVDAPPPVTPAPAAVSNGPIVLQVSAHGKREDADPVVALLKRKGFPASIVTVSSDTLFHVQVGPYASVSEAEAAKKALEEQGFKPYLKK
jgi:cell division protein FtsN